jgi:hypothetical protein
MEILVAKRGIGYDFYGCQIVGEIILTRSHAKNIVTRGFNGLMRRNPCRY